MRTITKIGIAVIKDFRILLVRKRGGEFLILPGGKPELGEDDITALCREVAEELGCSIDIGSLAFTGVFRDVAAGMSATNVEVKLYIGELIGTPVPQAEIEECFWVELLTENDAALAPSLRNSIMPSLRSHAMMDTHIS